MGGVRNDDHISDKLSTGHYETPCNTGAILVLYLQRGQLFAQALAPCGNNQQLSHTRKYYFYLSNGSKWQLQRLRILVNNLTDDVAVFDNNISA